MIKDNLIDCPLCGEKGGCYAIDINETKKSYLCLGCGHQSSDLLMQGEFDIEEYEYALPELYKDLKKLDFSGRVWYPSAVNIQDKGTVFANGKDSSNWQWSAIKNVLLTEEEAEKPVFKGKTHKSDSKTLKDFGTDFLSALEYIGVEF